MNNDTPFSFVTHPEYPHCEKLVVDGEIDEDSLVNYIGKIRVATVRNVPAMSRMLTMRCIELASQFGAVHFQYSGAASPHEFLRGVTFDWLRSKDEGPRLEFEVPLNVRTWNRTWSIPDFLDALGECGLESSSDVSIHDPTRHPHGTVAASCHISFPMRDQNALALDVLHERTPITVRLLNGALDQLDARALQHGVLRIYRFRPQIHGAACRYLDYFAQFLSDLGIDAHSTRQQQAGAVIFTVTAISQTQALYRIAEALAIYLNLPSLPEFAEVSGPLQDPAVVDLRRVVQQMQSELVRARADIDSLKIPGRLPQLGLPSDGAVSADPVPHDPSVPEPLMGGLISLGTLEKLGVRFELGAFLRLLKRTKRRLTGTRSQ